MARKIKASELMNPIDAIDAKVRDATGVSLRDKIAQRRYREALFGLNDQKFFMSEFGYLPVKNLYVYRIA